MMDVRSKKSIPIAQSEDQEDELLSIVSIKRLESLPIFFDDRPQFESSATKIVVGTQLGMLSIFNRSNGWGDCVDRIPGHVNFNASVRSFNPRCFVGILCLLTLYAHFRRTCPTSTRRVQF